MADWIPLGDRAIRFARPAVPARALVRAVRAWPGVVDVVVARYDVAAYFADAPAIGPDKIAALATLRDDNSEVREVEIRVVYNGPDLAIVARTLKLSVADVK